MHASMALVPDSLAPHLETLGPTDVPETLAFLERDPVLNVYPIALVMRDALAKAAAVTARVSVPLDA